MNGSDSDGDFWDVEGDEGPRPARRRRGGRRRRDLFLVFYDYLRIIV